MCEIVKIYINEAKNLSKTELINHLETFIHGIEIDPILHKKCIDNLNLLTKNLGVVKWDIILGNTLEINKFDGKMDFVVGNPPYIRIHDVKQNIKNFSFSQNAMSDLYLTFFEIGLKMLKKDGILGYITPSSYFNSLAAKTMRKYFIDNKILHKIVDLEHFQPFNATTYTAITILKNSSSMLKYYTYDENNKVPKFEQNLAENDFFINENFYFNVSENIKNILNFNKKSKILVKNGFATLCDEFFICDFEKNEYIIDIVKSSTGAFKRCIYPYDKNANLINFDEISGNLRHYFEENKQKLQNRSLQNKELWWGFGRTQAINDVYKDKIAINSLIRDKNDIKLTFAPNGVGVYGGLYILWNDIKDIEKMLVNDDFMDYVRVLKKYKSGGYYTFSSKDLEKYLNFKKDENG